MSNAAGWAKEFWNPDTKMFDIPDAGEFIRACGWRDGKFFVPDTIEAVISYADPVLAGAEALCLHTVIMTARKIEQGNG